MKQKFLMMFLLTVIFSVAFVSAADFTVSTSTPVALTKSNNQTSFLITPTLQTGQAIDMVVTLPSELSDGTNTITLNPPYSISFNNILNAETQGPVVISYTGIVPTNFKIGTYIANVNITSTDTTNSSNILTQTIPISFISDFCDSGENGTDLSISRVDFNNNDGDDDEWSPLDEITLRVDISNDGSKRIKDVTVEIGLINQDGKDIAKYLDGLDRKTNLGSINDGDDKTINFNFKVPVDFEEEDYKFIIKAYSDDLKEKSLCIAHSSDLNNDYYQIIKGQRETDEENHIVLDNIIVSPETEIQCGEIVQLSAEIVNVGDYDYEDQVKVTLYNKELEINTEEIVMEDFDQGDSSIVNFDFEIPQTAAEKTYTLELRTYYDYDGDDSYDITSEKKFTKSIVVKGNCIATPVTPTAVDPTINAELDSSTPEAIAGKEVIITATITNNDIKDTTYTISVSGNTAWSSLVSVDPQTTITIPAGQSKDISITLNIDSTAEGKNQLTIKAAYGNNQVKSVPVDLTITQPSAAFGSVGQHLAQNWYIYAIILVNLILIIAIIVVIVKMMKPRRAD